jgi:tetratricopeptide (TPR) repeat protein
MQKSNHRRVALNGFNVAWWAAMVVLTFSFPAAASPVRHLVDARDIERLTANHPAAVALLERGETLAAHGDFPEALAALQEAAKAAPESPLVARRECQVLTAMGRRAEALQSCVRAVRDGASPIDMRAMVGAFMSGQEKPTSGELAQAMRLARRARDATPEEPWGYAAECDIAARIGDAAMLESCLGELARVAPTHAETKRAFAASTALRFTWRTLLAWIAVALVGLGTLAHWARVSLGRARLGQPAVLLLLVAGSLTTARARAQAIEEEPHALDALEAHPGLLSDWPIDEKNPESSVPDEKKKERNPLQFGYWLMDITYKGTQATKRGDHEAAIRYYRALAKAVPDRSVSFTRLCESYQAAGQWKKAADACATALTRPGVTAAEYAHFFAVMLAKKESLTNQEIEVLTNVIQHLREDPAGHDMADDLECQLGVRLEDSFRLQECTAALVARAPHDPKTISYQWALAVARDDFDGAEGLIASARETSMNPEGIDQMVRGLSSLRETRRSRFYAWGFGGLAVVLAGGAAMVFTSRRRRVPRPA